MRAHPVIEALRRGWNAFWFETPVLRSRLTTFRVGFFALLAFDQWILMVPHAPRYGAAGFNVSHVPYIDAVLPVPDAETVTVMYMLGGFLALRVAIGLSVRASLVGLTVLYSAAYYWSQQDSYQHHYLITLLLLLCCFAPLHDLPGLDRARAPDTGGDARYVRSWAMRLVYTEISIVYFYTAVTKATRYWLDGWALDRIITVEWVRDAYATVGDALGWSALGPYAFVSHVIMIWQFFVAVAFLFPRLRPLACVTGPLFHVLVEVIELDIGWFSYYMIATYYILLFPDRWFLALAQPVGRLLAPAQHLFDRAVDAGATMASKPIAVGVGAACGVLALAVPLPAVSVLAACIGSTTLAALWPAPDPVRTRVASRAVAHVAAAFVMMLALRMSDVPYDYYRFWAGDLARRGQLEDAAARYERANALAGTRPARHFHLAEIYVRLGRSRAALRAYREGLEREPDSERGRRGLEDLLRQTGLSDLRE